MKIEIVTIGDELLIGQVIDSNSAWIGQQLNNAGFDIARINSISDSEEEIINILNETAARADVVLITGGLGPTKDDITKATLCKFFKTDLIFNQEVYDDIVNLLKGRVTNINELNRHQAMVPRDCKVIRNPVGTAPIMWFEKGEKTYVSMPGVPYEMKQAMAGHVIPMLVQKYKQQVVLHKTVLVYGIPEAVLAEQLSEWEDNIPTSIKVAYLPSPGRIRLRLSARGTDRGGLEKVLSLEIDKLTELLGESIGGYEDVPTSALVASIMKENKLTLATAESCTGGNIAHEITMEPGSSKYFYGSVVSYNNQVKTNVLGVASDILVANGAVSQPVVEQMAVGVKDLLKVDYALATSGIAGPDGGSAEKPVGLVWIAIAGPNGVESKVFQFGKVRESNIKRSTEMAFIMLKSMLEKDRIVKSK